MIMWLERGLVVRWMDERFGWREHTGLEGRKEAAARRSESI